MSRHTGCERSARQAGHAATRCVTLYMSTRMARLIRQDLKVRSNLGRPQVVRPIARSMLPEGDLWTSSTVCITG